MDIRAALVMILVGATIVAWVRSPWTEGALDTFAAGFLPYRDPGWPRGVQEEEPVPWSLAEPRDAERLDDRVTIGPDDGPEIVELSGPTNESIVPVVRI